MSETATPIASSIRTRARRLRTTAWLSLAVTVLAIVGGALFFWYAGSIALNDIRARASSSTAEFAASLEREKLLRIQLEQWDKKIQETSEGKDGAGLGCGPVCRGYVAQRDKVRALLNELTERQTAVVAPPATDKAETLASPSFVNTTLTRVLVVALLVFLVKILNAQYRYALRMSHHLDAVADAIELTATDFNITGFSEVLKSMGAPAVDFAAIGNSPTATVPELLKALKPV